MLYASHMTPGVTTEDIARLVGAAQQRNRRLDITGALIRCDHHFVQVIEGRDADVAELMSHIKSDRRHFNLKVFYEQQVTTRLFNSFAMGFVERLDVLRDLERLSSGDMTAEEFIELMQRVIAEESAAPYRR